MTKRDIPLTLPADAPYRIAIEDRGDVVELTPGEVGAMALPLGALANPDIRGRVKRAGLIFGWDRATRRLILFYGESIYQEFMCGHATEWESPFIIAFQYDSSPTTDELKYLIAAIEVLKGEGSCCYR